eukprot:c19445_g1_i1 orf=695-961(-)
MKKKLGFLVSLCVSRRRSQGFWPASLYRKECMSSLVYLPCSSVSACALSAHCMAALQLDEQVKYTSQDIQSSDEEARIDQFEEACKKT